MSKVLKIVKRVVGGILGTIVILGTIYMFIQVPQRRVILDARAIQATINVQRDIAEPVERTAITDSIIEINKEIEFYKNLRIYFKVFITPEFDTIDYVK